MALPRTRESGVGLEQHLARSRLSAARLDQEAPDDTHRLSTDGLTVDHIAGKLLSLIDWA
ncbi:hypothetical protein [Arthrobacter sp. H5]|uniref:hypothetical protein n=1 Tax=Arthrobacter sp. H5 TaxID=1267973 RepID=UPI00048A1B36|nr:hypothetical protein [Arthrobacter sp. H5]